MGSQGFSAGLGGRRQATRGTDPDQAQNACGGHGERLSGGAEKQCGGYGSAGSPACWTTLSRLAALGDRARTQIAIARTIEGAPVGSALLQTLRAHARVGTELLSAAGVTPPHEIVLLYLEENGPVAQTELVHYLARDRSTVTLQAMERAGLVVRRPSPTDKRAMVVEMTAAGAKAAPRAKAAWQELERRAVSGLGKAQQRDLVAALNAIRDALNGA
jgi:MarR family transcriptional regulator, lower aerobic nicotinate degradation pathway regulator